MGEITRMSTRLNIREVYFELQIAVSNARREAAHFNGSLIMLDIMVIRIQPIINEIDKLKGSSNHSIDVGMLIDLLRNGKLLIHKCLRIKPWNIIPKYKQTKKLIKLYNSLQFSFLRDLHILAHIRIHAAILGGRNADEEIVHTGPPLSEPLFDNEKGDILLDVISAVPKQQCRRFTLAEVQSATDNFNDAFVIGRGGFGKVFKGIVNGATIVAVKRLDPTSKQGSKEFYTEIELLSKFRHCHLVSLIGYCYNSIEMILVYEYMVNGSMADHLLPKEGRNEDSCILSWVQRLKICIGAARGIDYLHTGTGVLQRVIHRDVKSSNILLDKNWAAKVSDFGLCKIGPANQSYTHVSTCVRGTPGYCDPDYFLTHRVTRKSDVYAFGVVLLEVLSGRPAVDHLRLPKEHRSLVAWAKKCFEENVPHKLIDPNIKWEIHSKSLEVFVKIADQCLDSNPKKRPQMAELVTLLELALSMQTSKDSSLLDDSLFNFGNIETADEAGTHDVDELPKDDQGPQNIIEDEPIDPVDNETDHTVEKQIPLDEVTKLLSEKIETPKIGMILPSVKAFERYYSSYGNGQGFAVAKRSSTSSYDGKVIYVTFACTQGITTQNTMRTECQARIIVSRQNDGSYKLNHVVLDHNHVLHLLENDAQTSINQRRVLHFGRGDAEAVHKYFLRMQARNSGFFYALDVDNEGRARNMFWADARSRATYEEFGDVVRFDTRYLTNKYDMPFAPFVGVNHHGESVLFGCALVSSEDKETYLWLFETFKSCMRRVMPKAIITDECEDIQNAIEKVFPDTHYSLCLWHIMKKLPEKLSGYDVVNIDFQKCIYNSVSKEGFKVAWTAIVEKHNLQKNLWLKRLYENRSRWVPIYVKDSLFTGMSITQSEVINTFFDGYVNSKTTLKQFVEQYDEVLCKKLEDEKQANYKSFYKTLECITRYPFEKQFQDAYTNSKFEEFQAEIRGIDVCLPNLVCDQGGFSIYDVSELVSEGSTPKDVQNKFEVQFNEHTCEANCACKLFEFKGILCRHALTIFIACRVKMLPESYILRRWRKDVKRKYDLMSSCDDKEASLASKRVNEICNSFEAARVKGILVSCLSRDINFLSRGNMLCFNHFCRIGRSRILIFICFFIICFLICFR